MSMERILEVLRQRIGLDASSVGAEAVAAAVRRGMHSMGVADTETMLQRITTSTSDMWQLVEEVVVKETWFSRDSAPFAYLMHFVRTEWRGDRVLKVLSAPCASGEEPYSLAMALLEAGLPQQRFLVHAVDISERALERARAGRYGPNSFRGESLEFKDKYFTQQGREWLLRDRIKELVTFTRGNLTQGLMAVGQGPYDVIFCRNFLIYLDTTAKDRVERELAHLLHPDGVLCVGHAEAAAILGRAFAPVGWPRSFSFRFKPAARRKGFPGHTSNTHAPQDRPFDPSCLDSIRSRLALLKRHVAQLEPQAPPATPAPATNAPPLDVEHAMGQAQLLADQGDLEQALILCEQILADAPMDARAHHLAGIVLHALGRESDAEEALSRTVYLDPQHYEALAQLALIRSRQGDDQGARRFKERAERALRRREPQAEVRP